jgi:hypothetical protein
LREFPRFKGESNMRWRPTCVLIVTSLVFVAERPSAAELRVGFAAVDITPSITAERPVWIGGYGMNRRATGVHDPLFARAVILADGQSQIALVSADLVGLQIQNVERVRARLHGFTYVLVSSTHNHEGPDVIGLWGPKLGVTGVDPAYLTFVEDRIVAAVHQAAKQLVPARAYYGTAADETLLHDARLPIVYDDVLRVLRFRAPDSDETIGVLVQWNCHPESLEDKNTLVTTDFVFATIAELERRYQCPVAYFTGTVGGLLTVPEGRLKNAEGKPLMGGDFELAIQYGKAVAALAVKALEKSEPIRLTPFAVAARRVSFPLANEGYRKLRAAGVLTRDAVRWTGDPYRIGPLVPKEETTGELALVTEVACLRMGELHVAAIPGEIYPELVYGKFQEPVEPNVDFPDAPLEPAVMPTLPGEKKMLVGLANDEVGYIIPKRQWDQLAPFAYGRDKGQYGEINSCGPEAAPVLLKALQDCVRELGRSKE